MREALATYIYMPILNVQHLALQQFIYHMVSKYVYNGVVYQNICLEVPFSVRWDSVLTKRGTVFLASPAGPSAPNTILGMHVSC